MPSGAADTVREWQRAGQARDNTAAAACLAEDVVVISPLTAQFRFEGRAQAEQMLRAAFAVIDSIEYHTAVGASDTRALFYNGRCGDQDFEEAQLLRFNPDGLITELTLFGRPLPGLTAVMARIGPEMLRSERPGRARLISAATRPLATITRLGEKRLVPLADPNRR